MPVDPPPIRRFMNFVRFCARRFKEDRCSEVAGSLTFTTLLALVPLVTIGLTVMSAFPVFRRLMDDVQKFIVTNFVPQQASRIITVYVEQFSENAARLTTLGVVILSVTAVLLMFTVENACNAIWRVRRQRPFAQRFLIYWAMLTLGPLLVGASLSLTSFLVALSGAWEYGRQAFNLVVLKSAPVLLSLVAFTLLYRTVPNRRVPLRHALMGGLAAALAFEAMKHIFAAYVSAMPTYKLVYGAFASFPIFLLWMYLSWLMVLIGAVIAAALARGRDGQWRLRETPEHRFHDAWTVLQVLAGASGGAPLDFARLYQETSLSLAGLEDTLEGLTRADIVHRVRGRGYLLARPAAAIRVAEIYRLFLLEHRTEEPGSVAGHPLLARLTSTLDVSVEEAFAPTGVGPAKTESERAKAE